MTSRENRTNLKKVLKRFSRNDLVERLCEEFPEISWTDIQTKIFEKKKRINKENISKEATKCIIKCEIPSKILENRIAILELYCISSSKRVWYSYQMCDQEKNFVFSIEQLKNDLKTAIIKNYSNVNIEILMQSNAYWLRVVLFKIVKHKLTECQPVYFAYFPNCDYLFVSRKNCQPLLVKCVTKGLGYVDCKSGHLHGKDLQSLLILLQNRNQKANSVLSVKNNIKQVRNLGKEIASGIDFTQYWQRKDYADKLMGPKLPVLSQAGYDIREMKWAGRNPVLRNITTQGTVRFVSDNLFEMIKGMITNQQFSESIPAYISSLPLLGRNEITLRKKN